MKKEGKITQLFTLISFLVALAAESVLIILVGAMHGDKQISDANYIYASFGIPQICYILSITAFAVVWRVPATEFFRPKNVRPLPYAYMLLIALGLFFFALLPNFYLQKAFYLSGSKSTVLLPPLRSAGEITAAILFICILPAIGEEMLFRKTFCEGMEGNNEWVTILLGGLFFSLSHMNLVQTVHQFVLGCVLCFLYIRTRNITLTMIVHFLNNLLALFLSTWTQGLVDWQSTVVLGVTFAIGLVLLGAGVYLTFWDTKKSPKGQGKIETYTIILLVLVGALWAVSVTSSFIS